MVKRTRQTVQQALDELEAYDSNVHEARLRWERFVEKVTGRKVVSKPREVLNGDEPHWIVTLQCPCGRDAVQIVPRGTNRSPCPDCGELVEVEVEYEE